MNNTYEQILHLLNEYCYRIDAGDLQGFAELFAHGTWEVLGDPAGAYSGSDAVLQALQNVTLYDGLTHTKHVLSNIDINVDESDTSATARSYVTLYQAVPPDFPLQAIFIGNYNDQFEKIDAVWRFKLRQISPDLIGDLSHHRADMADG